MNSYEKRNVTHLKKRGAIFKAVCHMRAKTGKKSFVYSPRELRFFVADFEAVGYTKGGL